jgi:hypothetical protein
VKLLVLNGDLPIFPGRAGHEYLHTTRLARLDSALGISLADGALNLKLWKHGRPIL